MRYLLITLFLLITSLCYATDIVITSVVNTPSDQIVTTPATAKTLTSTAIPKASTANTLIDSGITAETLEIDGGGGADITTTALTSATTGGLSATIPYAIMINGAVITYGDSPSYILTNSTITASATLSLDTADSMLVLNTNLKPDADDSWNIGKSDTRWQYGYFSKTLIGGGRITATERVTTSPYSPDGTEEVIFVDTDGGDITVNLPAGVEGTHYKIINCGSSDNDVTIEGNGAEKVHGEDNQTLYDGEVLDLTYNVTEGWW